MPCIATTTTTNVADLDAIVSNLRAGRVRVHRIGDTYRVTAGEMPAFRVPRSALGAQDVLTSRRSDVDWKKMLNEQAQRLCPMGKELSQPGRLP